MDSDKVKKLLESKLKTISELSSSIEANSKLLHSLKTEYELFQSLFSSVAPSSSSLNAVPIQVTVQKEKEEDQNSSNNTSESENFDNVDIASPPSLNHSIKTITTTNDVSTTITTTIPLFKKKFIPEIEQQQEQGKNEENEAMLNDSRRILVEDDNKSESMSLVSLDQEEILSSSASSTSNYYKSPKDLSSSPQLPRPSTNPTKRDFASPVSSRNSQYEITFQDSSNTAAATTTTASPPPRKRGRKSSHVPLLFVPFEFEGTVYPTGGNNRDPFNLASLDDGKVNAETPKSSRMPRPSHVSTSLPKYQNSLGLKCGESADDPSESIAGIRKSRQHNKKSTTITTENVSNDEKEETTTTTKLASNTKVDDDEIDQVSTTNTTLPSTSTGLSSSASTKKVTIGDDEEEDEDTAFELNPDDDDDAFNEKDYELKNLLVVEIDLPSLIQKAMKEDREITSADLDEAPIFWRKQNSGEYTYLQKVVFSASVCQIPRGMVHRRIATTTKNQCVIISEEECETNKTQRNTSGKKATKFYGLARHAFLIGPWWSYFPHHCRNRVRQWINNKNFLWSACTQVSAFTTLEHHQELAELVWQFFKRWYYWICKDEGIKYEMERQNEISEEGNAEYSKNMTADEMAKSGIRIIGKKGNRSRFPTCKYCEKNIAVVSLIRHLREVHNIYSYKCAFCPLFFRTKTILTDHEDEHTSRKYKNVRSEDLPSSANGISKCDDLATGIQTKAEREGRKERGEEERRLRKETEKEEKTKRKQREEEEKKEEIQHQQKQQKQKLLQEFHQQEKVINRNRILTQQKKHEDKEKQQQAATSDKEKTYELGEIIPPAESP